LSLLSAIFDLLQSSSATGGEVCPASSYLSLEDDGALIYAAFLQTYGINLHKDRLDWREFCVLLSCIPENTALVSVMKSRANGYCKSENINAGLEILFNKLEGL